MLRQLILVVSVHFGDVMPPWQKRLKDLSQLLSQCHRNYMEPELFRLGINQFLQTARTVTFIIQKNKDSIPKFESWYEKNVIEAWKNDDIMQWAKDARNKIEKEGDLDLHSTITLKLFFGYLEETDLNMHVSDSKLLHAGVKQLVRIAQKNLPSGVSRSAAIKVDRRWVSDSMPNHELLGAICVVYRKMYALCASLAKNLNIELDKGIASPNDFDDIAQETRQIRYFKLSTSGSFSMKTERKAFNPDDISPESVEKIRLLSEPLKADRTINGTHQWLASMAEMTFNRDGYHVPMAFLFNDSWTPIDMISFRPDDSTDKYIIWRDIGDRVRANGASAVAFIGEAWIRRVENLRDRPISSQPIIGEQLQVVLLDRNGSYREARWEILRNNDIPSLSKMTFNDSFSNQIPTFLAPVIEAFDVQKRGAKKNDG